MTSGSALTAVFAGFIRLVTGVNLEQVDIAQLFQCRQYLLVSPPEVGEGLGRRTILVTAMFDGIHVVQVCVQAGPRPGNRLGHNDSDPCGALGNASGIGKPSLAEGLNSTVRLIGRSITGFHRRVKRGDSVAAHGFWDTPPAL
jgi:hypothetical protein